MTHFINIAQFSGDQLFSLLKRAQYLKHNKQYPTYPQHTVAQLFYENSTRTRVSFEMAALNLGMRVINIDLDHSSENKGETVEDTITNLAAMGIDYFVIRHQQEGLQQRLAQELDYKIHIVNAGDGTGSHPSQALLDMMTIMEYKPQLADLNIAIVGDVRHSRVANSFQSLCKQLNMRRVTLICPKVWQPKEVLHGEVTHNLHEGLAQADVVMCLRIQRERLLAKDHLDINSYRRDFAITPQSLTHAKKEPLIMHPGPLNREIEIDSSVADGPQSVILEQVTNGVYARMAILEFLKQQRAL